MTVSDFEWAQGIHRYFWSERRVNIEFRDIIQGAYRNVQRLADKKGISMRLAALWLAVDRVAEASRTRGLYP